MPTASLPVTLVANTNENVNDLNTDLNYIIGLLNTLDESNVANLAAAFTTWKNTEHFCGSTFTGQGAATFIIPGGSAPTGASVVLPITAGTSIYTFNLDPADWTANSRTTKLRIRWHLIANGVAPAQTFTCGLYPISGFSAPGAGVAAGVTFGTVVSGSTAVFTTPALAADTTTLSTEFNCPTAGSYAFGLVNTGNMAANSALTVYGALQMRQV